MWLNEAQDFLGDREQGAARHWALPPVRVADKAIEGVTCVRLDGTVITAHLGH